MLKIISYNVNGIRAAIKKGFIQWVKENNYDIICLQETKAQNDQIDTSIFEELGYRFYHHPAQKKGYSGVAILTKIPPKLTKNGMDNPKYDIEGRVLQLHFDNFTVINAYFPSGTMGDVRQKYKMEFLYDFKAYINKVKQTTPRLVISGDYNICHKPIDINHPERHKKSSGFLPEERQWFDEFIADGFIDTFREYNPEPNQYSWWSYRANAREKNLGWRIDYHLVTSNLKDRLQGAEILPNVYHSDHCPVLVKIKKL